MAIEKGLYFTQKLYTIKALRGSVAGLLVSGLHPDKLSALAVNKKHDSKADKVRPQVRNHERYNSRKQVYEAINNGCGSTCHETWHTITKN